MSAQLYVFPTRQTRAPVPAASESFDEIVDVRAHFASLVTGANSNISTPYLTMVEGIDRLISEIGHDDASHLIKVALRTRGVVIST